MNLILPYTRISRGIYCLGVFVSIVCLAAGQPQESQLTLTLKVVDPDGEVVACVLKRIAPNGLLELLGDTSDEKPSITIPDGCKSGCILLFYPKAASEYRYGSVYCPYTKDTFTVKPMVSGEAKKLAQNLTAFTADTPTDSAKISFVANELADKAISKNTKEAYQLQSYVEAAKFFGASTAVTYDPKQKRTVPSPELQAKVEEFQKNNGLKKNGSLNYETLRAASGLTINDLLRSPLN
jgi:hypothetical protein